MRIHRKSVACKVPSSWSGFVPFSFGGRRVCRLSDWIFAGVPYRRRTCRGCRTRKETCRGQSVCWENGTGPVLSACGWFLRGWLSWRSFPVKWKSSGRDSGLLSDRLLRLCCILPGAFSGRKSWNWG